MRFRPGESGTGAGRAVAPIFQALAGHLAPDVDTLHALAADLAALLRPGDLLILRGPLGAGKTTFAQGIGAALGVPERLTSPTFVIARSHHGGRLPVIHVDAYRLGGVAELDDLDLDTEVEESVTLVEWGEGLAERLHEDDYLIVDIDRESEDGEARRVRLLPHGSSWQQRIGELNAT